MGPNSCVVGVAKEALSEAAKGLSKADIARGKAQLKLAAYTAAECVDFAIEDMGSQVRACLCVNLRRQRV